MSTSYWIWLRRNEHHKEWQWQVRKREARADTAFLHGWEKKRETAVERAKEALRVWLEAEATVETVQVIDNELVETPKEANRRRRYERASSALFAFVEPWKLPVNPENLDLMAYCALESADSERTLSECVRFAQDEIAKDDESQRKMNEAFLEDRK